MSKIHDFPNSTARRDLHNATGLAVSNDGKILYPMRRTKSPHSPPHSSRNTPQPHSPGNRS